MIDSSASTAPILWLDEWQEAYSTLQWQPNPQQAEQFQHLYALIQAGNQRLNLTRITEPHDFWEKHLWDSLRGMVPLLSTPIATDSFRVLDIGTGAGFPGIPAAIARPDWQVTLLDSTQKKIAFLETLVADLHLSSVTLLLGRVEAIAHLPQYRQQYDLVLLRAVSSASACAEYALPLLKRGGTAILYRGQWQAEETEALQPVCQTLGGALTQVDAFTTPLSHSIRHCIHIQKVASTPKLFPRAIGIPAKQPLTE